MGTTVEPNPDLVVGDRDVTGDVDEIPEEMPRLGVGVAPHTACEESVEATPGEVAPGRGNGIVSAAPVRHHQTARRGTLE